MRFRCSLFHCVFTFNKCNKLSRHFITKSLNKNKIMLLSTCVIGGIFLLFCRPVNPYGQHLKYQNVFFSSVPEKSLPFIRTDIASQLSHRRFFVRFFATFQFVVIFHIQHLVVLNVNCGELCKHACTQFLTNQHNAYEKILLSNKGSLKTLTFGKNIPVWKENKLYFLSTERSVINLCCASEEDAQICIKCCSVYKT